MQLSNFDIILINQLRKYVHTDRKFALVGIIPNQILCSFSSDKEARSGKRTNSFVKVENSHAVPVVAS